MAALQRVVQNISPSLGAIVRFHIDMKEATPLPLLPTEPDDDSSLWDATSKKQTISLQFAEGGRAVL